jgi:hypothetical protein
MALVVGGAYTHSSWIGTFKMASTASTAAPITFDEFRTVFSRAYNEFYKISAVDATLKRQVTSFPLTMEQFDMITKNLQYQKYVSLIDGRIRFDSLPDAPHGEIIGDLVAMISHQISGATGLPALFN